MLCEQYPHFHRFAKLLEQLADKHRPTER